jgi:hypothetical protein
LFAGALFSLALPRAGTYLRNGPVLIGWYPTRFGADPFKFTFMCTCSTTIQYELSLQFAQWGQHAPKFPSDTNFSNCGSNQCWAGIQKIQIPARISKIDIQWISFEVIFRLIPRVLDIIHHAIRQLNIWKLCRISEMLISSFNIRSKARYQG